MGRTYKIRARLNKVSRGIWEQEDGKFAKHFITIRGAKRGVKVWGRVEVWGRNQFNIGLFLFHAREDISDLLAVVDAVRKCYGEDEHGEWSSIASEDVQNLREKVAALDGKPNDPPA